MRRGGMAGAQVWQLAQRKPADGADRLRPVKMASTRMTRSASVSRSIRLKPPSEAGQLPPIEDRRCPIGVGKDCPDLIGNHPTDAVVAENGIAEAEIKCLHNEKVLHVVEV